VKLVLYILIFLTLSFQVHGQLYINDWKNFKNEKWTVSFEQSSYSIFNVKTIGELTFLNKADTSLKISFGVITLAERDSIFEKTLQAYFNRQSCRPVSANSKSFYSFNFKDFSYIYLVCQPNKRPSDCENLSEHIFRIRQDKNSH
jgi:hypothetical protein